MLPTLKKHRDLGKEIYKLPKNVQEVLPVEEIFEDGVFKTLGKFSKMYRFTDINYTTLSKEEKIATLRRYGDFLNSISPSMSLKITIISRNINADDYKKEVFLDETDELLGAYNKELNEVISGSGKPTDNLIQDFFITLTTLEKDYKLAAKAFDEIEISLKNSFSSMHSRLKPCNAAERVKVLYTFFKNGDIEHFRFDFDEYRDNKRDFRNIVVPTDMTFKRYGTDCFAFRLEDGSELFGRGLELNDYPQNALNTDFVQAVCSLHKNLIFSIDVVPIPTDEALKETTNISMSVENNINTFMRKARESKNFSASLPANLQNAAEVVEQRYNDLTKRDQHLFISTVTLVYTSSSKEQLERDYKEIVGKANDFACGFIKSTLRQAQCLQTTLPLGINKIENDRELTTECLSAHTPFRTQEIYQPTGIWYGKNTISGNIIMADRRTLQNGNAWILAQSGGGKSFAEKMEIQQVLAKDLGDVITIDPEGEMSIVAKTFGGSVVELRTGGDKAINALEMDKNYNEGSDPVKLKADYLITVCSQLLGEVTNKQRNALDKAIKNVYKEYKHSDYDETKIPTLTNLVETLAKGDDIAVDLSQDLMPFTANGSLDIFGKRTNVDLNNRFINFDIKDLGENLWSVGMLIILDSIYNKIVRNRKKNRTTYIYIDEAHLMFRERSTALFLQSLWKRVRKYNGYMIGITQDIDSLLGSDISRTMLSNSEIIRMLNMSQPNRQIVRTILDVTDEELSILDGSERGVGLLKFGSAIVPFNNRIDPNSNVYKLFDTSPNTFKNY